VPFLLRVELPDVPGSLGRVATAIGEAGGDIEAIEIVEKRFETSTAVDDVMLELPTGTMPDSVVSAVNALDDVRVIWISRYAGGGQLFLDLEVVDEMTVEPGRALDRLIELLPDAYRVDWAVRLHRTHGVGTHTSGAPAEVEFVELDGPTAYTVDGDEMTVFLAARVDGNEIIVAGRRGGPEFVASEIARMGHLVSLATSLARP
jgi:hypothetical protein